MLREVNGLREGEGLPALKVSDSLMAVAQAHWDHFIANPDDGPLHWRDFNIGENIACGKACFDKEKALYDQGVRGYDVGHYVNIVNPDYVVTGSAESSYQEFSSDSEWLDPVWLGYTGDSLHQGRVMSVDDYEADVNAYKAPLDKAVSDYDNVAKAADNAKTAYDRAKAAADAWNNVMFTVSFDTAGGSKVASQKVGEGAKASRPADPTRSGYSFDGWYKGGSKYDFSTPVTADMTLTAHWKAAPVVRTAAMHRLYNPYTGEHFYTADTTERDHLTGLGWRYEGVGWKAPAKSSTPVYRLYNGHVRGGDSTP